MERKRGNDVSKELNNGEGIQFKSKQLENEKSWKTYECPGQQSFGRKWKELP